MSELLQLLTLAKDGELSTRVGNPLTVATAHDAEIKQLREKVNEIITANRSVATVDLVTGLFICVCAIVCVGTIVYLLVKFDRRIKALESAKA